VRVALIALFLAACSHNTQTHPEMKGETGPIVEHAHADGGLSVVDPGAEKPAVVDPNAVTPAQPPPNVKIVIRTTPPKVFVSWGKKKLGITPLTIERPRNSGPMDLVLRSQGFFPVHTRAYTVKNDVIGVKMVKAADRMTIFGAKQEIPETPAALDPLDPANALAPPAAPPTPAPVPAPTP
jgi:hypothetical protein